MEIQIFKSKEHLASQLAGLIKERLQRSGNLGFATGRTMEPIYAHLRALAPVDVKADVWILDEYVGLRAEHPQSYRYFLNELVFRPLGVPASKIHFPRLDELAPVDACELYERELSACGQLSVQLLGLGLNGHVGLNEPGSTLESSVRVVEIAQKTRLSNQSYFADLASVPTHAVTLGLRNLRAAQELWLIVTGTSKAEILKQVLEGPVSAAVPATLLRDHPGLKLFADADAASLLAEPVR